MSRPKEVCGMSDTRSSAPSRRRHAHGAGAALVLAPLGAAPGCDVAPEEELETRRHTATSEPGQPRGAGAPEIAVEVNRERRRLHAFDATGAHHTVHGDGRVSGVASLADLDQRTLTICRYTEGERGVLEDVACSGPPARDDR
jgi:hypothetical protein